MQISGNKKVANCVFLQFVRGDSKYLGTKFYYFLTLPTFSLVDQNGILIVTLLNTNPTHSSESQLQIQSLLLSYLHHIESN